MFHPRTMPCAPRLAILTLLLFALGTAGCVTLLDFSEPMSRPCSCRGAAEAT